MTADNPQSTAATADATTGALRVAYIVSSSYSGSTLLSMLLNTHPDIATISELPPNQVIARSPDFTCSCGEPIRRCPFFREVREELKRRGVTFSVEHMDLYLAVTSRPALNRVLTQKLPYVQSSSLERARDRLVRMLLRSRWNELHARNDAFMRAVLKIQGGSVFLDADKDPYRMTFLAERHDTRPIYLYKNGIAGVYSFVKNSRGELGVEEASRRWFSEQVAILRRLRAMDPSKVLVMSYSSLCADVADSLGRIHRHLGVEPLPLGNIDAVPHHVIGNSMRLARIEEIREDRRWQDALADADFAVYRAIRARYERQLGDLRPEMLADIWA